jgi:hypothetical protein
MNKLSQDIIQYLSEYLEFKEILSLICCKKWKIYIIQLKSKIITQEIIKQEKYRNLKYLNITDNKNITDINHLHKLKILNASGSKCKLGDKGISDLAGNIKELIIINNQFITDINHLQKLEILNASEYKLGNKGISELKNIKELYISNNKNFK